MNLLAWLRDEVLRQWLKYQLRLVSYRRTELRAIVEREEQMLAYEEHALNVRLRELKSRQLHSRLLGVRVR